MVSSYGWGTFCHVSRIPDFVNRVSARENELLSLNGNEIALWTADIDRIWKAISRTLDFGPWIGEATEQQRNYVKDEYSTGNFFPGVNRDNLIKSLALVHQFGRLDQFLFEESMESSDIEWFKSNPIKSKQTPSPTHNRKAMSDAAHNSMRLWESRHDVPKSEKNKSWRRQIACAGRRNHARANQWLFDYLRDASQLLSKGCAAWAQRSQEESQPLRVLAIKDHISDVNERIRVEEAFREAFDIAFRTKTVELHCVHCEVANEADSSKRKHTSPRWDN